MVRKATADWAALKLKGKTFAFTGAFRHGEREDVAKQVRAEGGRVVAEVTASVDYLVAGSTRSRQPSQAERKAQRLNQKQGAAIQIIDEDQLHEMCKPSRDEVLDMFRAGPKGLKRWKKLADAWHFSPLDLCGLDLRKVNLGGADLSRLKLEGINFNGAHLEGTTIREAKCCTFDGAHMAEANVSYGKDCSFVKADLRGASIFDMQHCTFDGANMATDDWGSFSSDMTDCSVKNANLRGVCLNPADISRSDFTGATMPALAASYTVAHDTVFRNTDLSGSDMEASKFDRADFTGADLSRALLYKSVFTAAKLIGVKLIEADLRNTTWTAAELTGADLRNANLAGADFTKAILYDADFQGANLNGANFKGVDLSKARNVTLQQPVGVAIGPNMRKLAKAAKSSAKLETSAELDLGAAESVELHMSARHYSGGYHAGAGYSHEDPSCACGSSVESPSFEKGMQNLLNLWYRGKLRPGSIHVVASKCPLDKAELKALAIAAWYEACGLSVPSEDQLAQQEQAQKSADEQLREQLFAELRGGSAAVKKWNARDYRERRRAGTFRRLDLTGAKLAGIDLDRLDFQDAVFDGASLRDATCWNCQLANASFKGANLTKALLAGSKCSDANFEGARLVQCNLRAANFRRASFRDADLTDADFMYSDLCGADLTGANLQGVTLGHTKFDEKTRLPAGFVLPEEMIWIGKGSDPRLAPPAPLPPSAGPLDFAAFLQRLALHTDQARLSKALQMLKAERFQLFADIAPDAVVGVVKSQTNPDLVYSCRLTSGGDFSCCTQNLNVCGGLRGAPCKHLLVLLAGLSKASQLNPATADAWVQLSRGRKAVLDKDAMSETFLRYKGAEAGEIDWRPTETIPEDYYAL